MNPITVAFYLDVVCVRWLWSCRPSWGFTFRHVIARLLKYVYHLCCSQSNYHTRILLCIIDLRQHKERLLCLFMCTQKKWSENWALLTSDTFAFLLPILLFAQMWVVNLNTGLFFSVVGKLNFPDLTLVHGSQHYISIYILCISPRIALFQPQLFQLSAKDKWVDCTLNRYLLHHHLISFSRSLFFYYFFCSSPQLKT